ncbi:MAG: hypothetical protein ABIQ16_01210 [Polyangiaceae bacterium]
MLTRIIFLCAATLIGFKLFAPHRLRALGKQVDRVVNATLIALALVYSAQVAIWFFSRP